MLSYLGDFLFPPQRADTPVRALSGGERNRLLLARLFARPANLLVLDEPTNDLDIESLELLESTLQTYPGTLLLVSHDRTFLDNVVTQTLVAESRDGTRRDVARVPRRLQRLGGAAADGRRHRRRRRRGAASDGRPRQGGGRRASDAPLRRAPSSRSPSGASWRRCRTRSRRWNASSTRSPNGCAARTITGRAPRRMKADRARAAEIEHALAGKFERWGELDGRKRAREAAPALSRPRPVGQIAYTPCRPATCPGRYPASAAGACPFTIRADRPLRRGPPRADDPSNDWRHGCPTTSTTFWILSSLNDEDLTLQVHDDLYNGLRDEVMEATNILLSRGWAPERVLNDALVEGMRIVGIDFRDGILFVPEVLLAANSMKGGMEILRPLLAETGVEPIGKMVIGTVKGDIHDIGKNLVAMMMEGAGFEVIDLGINNPVEKYLAALARAQARHPRTLRAAHDDDAVHEGRDRHDEGRRHPRRLHRAGRRRAAERGLRQGGGRGRLLPRRGDRRGDGQGADRHARARCASRPS